MAVAEAVREACVAPGPGGGDPVRPGLVRLPLGLAEGETEAAAAVEALGLRVARPGARGGGEGGGGGGGAGERWRSRLCGSASGTRCWRSSS